mmetsp:Transcript_12903/g.29211  ORF Transcript_12903/g.29211 Transcript_12903/m.29211 type:complete len:477 (-) Transcript_12903:117-1547(-)
MNLPPPWTSRTALESGDIDSPNDLVSRCLRRSLYRKASGGTPLQQVVVVLSGYTPKIQAVGRALMANYGIEAVGVPPALTRRGADIIADALDAAGFTPSLFIPFVDNGVGVADVVNQRLGKPTNDPTTSRLRRDKFEQQECLRQAGLPSVAQCATASVEEAVCFAESQEGPVVVKPRDSAGGDGVWLCTSSDEVRTAFELELGRTNIEDSFNYELIVMEALTGEEWIVNTVSLSGEHKVVEVWHGPPKLHSVGDHGPHQFVYNVQYLAVPGASGTLGGCCPWMSDNSSTRTREVIDFTFAALDAVGLQNGAAHTELVWHRGQPHLLEINSRCTGGLPRGPTKPNQVEMLAMSYFDPFRFLALPVHPERTVVSATTVFLRSPCDGFLLADAITQLASMTCFFTFDKGLFGIKAPFQDIRVRKTVSYLTSPGCVVLHGPANMLADAVEQVRAIEAFAYVTCDDSHSQCLAPAQYQRPL